MQKRTICLLNDSFPPEIDGVSNAVVNYARELKKTGGEPVVVTPRYPGADDSGFDFPVLRYPGLDLRSQVGYIAGYPFSPAVLKELTEKNVDLLHSHCPISSTLLARSIREKLDAPLVMTYHTKFDIDIEKAVRGKLLQEGAISALVANISACDEVWVVSDGAGQNLRSLGYEGEYTVMQNGVDVPRGRLPREKYMQRTAGLDLPEGVPVYLFVGRLMWYKGLKIILDALAALRSQNIDFRMVFVGGGTDRQEIEAYAQSLGLDDRVFFLGAVYDREQLCAWYCRADLFLFPSTFDTNGLVVREAAACGLPTALVRGSCAAEGVTDRRNGFLIEENAASLAVLLASLGHNREYLRAVGETACEELYLSWGESVRRAAERYEVVIDKYKSGAYKKKPKLEDRFLSFTGSLMDFFADVQEKRRESESAAGAHLEELRSRVSDFFNPQDRYL